MDKNKVRLKAFNFLEKFDNKIRTKLNNVCSKTGAYGVPLELFQKRTPRNNRVLISWKSVLNNNLSLKQLETFSGGVVVEFINEDFFNEKNQANPLFLELKKRLGCDQIVSSIISFRGESGSSSSDIPRKYFDKFTSNFELEYNNNKILINKSNYNEYAIKQVIKRQGTGNDTWNGFLFVSIKGGQQDTIETHRGMEYTLFNPACEYANEEVKIDIDLVVSFFAMKSIDKTKLNEDDTDEYVEIMFKLREALKNSEYDSEAYSGNLYDYCINHPSVAMINGELTDPIQLKRILISNFAIEDRNGESIDFTHDEAVNYDRYYWDKKKNCILSPARPSNIFWSYHLSNMMQQDYSLKEYFEYEEKRFSKRQSLLNKDKVTN